MSHNRPTYTGNDGIIQRQNTVIGVGAFSPYQMGPDDDVVTSLQAMTVNLPPTPRAGDRHEIHASNIGAGNLTVAPQGGFNLNGAGASINITTNQTMITVFDGVQWTASTIAHS